MSYAETKRAVAGGNFRWVICALLFFSVAINYVDRLVIGILKKPLSQELNWSDRDYGYIAAAFSFAYAVGYLIGGRSMDRLGVKHGLPIFVSCWSLAAAAHGLIGFIGVDQSLRLQYPSFNFAEGTLAMLTLVLPMTAAGFMLARIALGISEGGNFPGAIKAVAEWFPVSERALATGWFNSGTNVGAILCPIAVPWLYEQCGWQTTFYITGILGFLWVAVWLAIYDAPEIHPKVSSAELAYIKGRPSLIEAKGAAIPLRQLLKHRAVWAYIIASMLAAPAWGFYQFFLPDFLDRQFSLSLQAVGWWTGAFFAIAAIGGIAGGWLAGKLMQRGWTVNAARKITLLLCALAVVPVLFAPFTGNVLLAVLIIGLAGSAHQGWSANLYSVVSDTMPREAISSVVGLGGFLCFFTGGFVNAITGQILYRTGSYVSVFAYFSGMYLISLAAIHILVPRIGRGTE